jgi:primosomal replication protein N''
LKLAKSGRDDVLIFTKPVRRKPIEGHLPAPLFEIINNSLRCRFPFRGWNACSRGHLKAFLVTDFAQRYALETARRDEGQDVGLFVKNLENVQGDERDIILFSTTFGHDRNGRFARRFGPLGAIGGERRLNVAVTRAKRSITIVSSMRIAEVAGALNRGDGQPVLTPAGYLQLYLAYAEGVSKGNASPVLDSLRALTYSQGPTGGNADRLVADVRAVLSDLGYLVETGGGSGGLSVDLAVRHPGHQKGYALGIDCDRLIKLGWATRFSHVWRPDVLLRRQWRLHQVWAHRWWGNRQAEIDQLRWAIDSATAEPVVEVATTSATTRSQSPPSSANQQFLPGYYSMEF